MTGSLFSLPGTQYINVEHIHLVEERERQLPTDRRPRIQQGFAASLFLPLFLFSGNFWLQMTFRGEQTHFIGGQAIGPLEDPCATFRCFWPCKICKNTLSPGHWATGCLSPIGRATGPLSPSGRATGVHFCKISKVRSKNVI